MSRQQVLFWLANGLYGAAICCFLYGWSVDLQQYEDLVVGAWLVMFLAFLADAVLMCFVAGHRGVTWVKSLLAFFIWNIAIPGYGRLVMGMLSEGGDGVGQKLEDTIAIILLVLGLVVLILPHIKVKKRQAGELAE